MLKNLKTFGLFDLNEAAEIKPESTIIIKTKNKAGATKIADYINKEGKKAGSEAWVVDGTTDVAANIHWSPGFKNSFQKDMEKFEEFISFDRAPKEKKETITKFMVEYTGDNVPTEDQIKRALKEVLHMESVVVTKFD